MPQAKDTIIQWFYKAAYRAALLFWMIFRPAAYGVYIAVWADRKVLLIHNSYKPGWSLPGGCLKSGEAADAAGIREIREETGLYLSFQQLSFVGLFDNPYEFKRDHIYLFETELLEIPFVTIDNREVVMAGFFDSEKALKLDLFPVVRTYLKQKQRERRGE